MDIKEKINKFLISEKEYKVDLLDIDDVNIIAKKMGIKNVKDSDAIKIMQVVYKKYGRSGVTDQKIKDEIQKQLKESFLEEQYSLSFKDINELKDAAQKINKDSELKGKISNVDLFKKLILFKDKNIYEKAKKLLKM